MNNKSKSSFKEKSFAGRINNMDSGVNWVRNAYPEDEVVFVSSTSLLETKSISSARWYQRISERRTNLILTNHQLVLKNNMISPLTVFYAFVSVIFFIFFLLNREWRLLVLALLGLVHILQYLSYQCQIQYKDIRKLIIDSRGGIRTKLIIDTGEEVIHAGLSQPLSEEGLRVISSHIKPVVYS